jgi:hypothetical protein
MPDHHRRIARRPPHMHRAPPRIDATPDRSSQASTYAMHAGIARRLQPGLLNHRTLTTHANAITAMQAPNTE